MNKAFTYEQATDIAEDFVDLEGTGIMLEIDGEATGCFVKTVLVVPYPETERGVFLAAIENDMIPGKALETYTGQEFEVLILATGDDGNALTIPIRNYASVYMVNYRFP